MDDNQNVETFWVLTNQALTEVNLRVTSSIAMNTDRYLTLLRQVFPELAITPDGIGASLGADGKIIALQHSAGKYFTYEFYWEPLDAAAALAETPEFLEAERRAEQLVSLLAVLTWRNIGGQITDLHGNNIDAEALMETFE